MFWDVFNKKKDDGKEHSTLHYELQKRYPNLAEEELIKLTCIAGLFARVAYVDFHLDENEREHMGEVLNEWTEFDKDEVKSIVDIAIHNIKELAGLENHLYIFRLKEVLDRDARFSLVESLFALAASDGVVENIESEEIRIIVKGFDLSDKHFLVARAKVSDKLKALKG